MNHVSIITAILSLVAGIGIFLIACSMMSSNLESFSGEKLKNLFGKASRSRVLGVGIGALGTAAIQSSGATTVMVIGFVNAGIMSLSQAATLIFGANIGTTITGQIVALGMFGKNTISTTVIFSAFAGIGACILSFSKKDLWKKLGGILAGFGMLFVGLSMMSGSMDSFAQLDSVRLFLAGIRSSVLLVVIGAIFTAVIQSSSVMTSIAIAMVVSGLISLDQGIYLTMGSNIGSCVVAIIAGAASGQNAKRTALIHLIFNISGVIVFMLVGALMKTATAGKITFAFLFGKMFPGAVQTQLAMFHTVFNLITVILILPLTDWLVRLVSRIIPDETYIPDPETTLRLYFIDEHMLKTPSLAVRQVKNEIVNMAYLAIYNWRLSLHMICTQDFEKAEDFRNIERELNYLNRELVKYIIRIGDHMLSQNDRIYLATTFHTISDLERVGDYAENNVEYAESLRNSGDSFSEEAVNEIMELNSKIEELFEHVMNAYENLSFAELAAADETEEEIDIMTDTMETGHIRRLNDGTCTPNAGAQYLSLASNAERVADHFLNVAKTIKDYAK